MWGDGRPESGMDAGVENTLEVGGAAGAAGGGDGGGGGGVLSGGGPLANDLTTEHLPKFAQGRY